MNCHLCKSEINTKTSYWLVDMKFCRNCYNAIIKGDLQNLVSAYEKDYRLMAKSFIGETIKDFFCNGFFGSRNYDLEGAKITKIIEYESGDIIVEVIKEDGRYDYGEFTDHWADWEQVYEHLKKWVEGEEW